MSICYSCGVDLDDTNRSEEHIILNALGGMLRSSDLLCKDCNSKMGSGADAELANQFQFLSGHLQIKRDRGSIPTTKGGKLADGTGINLIDGITPSFTRPKFLMEPIENGVCYSIIARSQSEMKTLLGRVAKSHPGFDIDYALSKVQKKVEKLKEPVHFTLTFGGKAAFQSIAKTAINFYIHSKGDYKNITHLIPYLFNEIDIDIVKHYHSAKPLYKKDVGEIIHLLHVVENKHSRMLYCYVEFFSAHSYLVLLTDNYEGKNFQSTYAYNLVTNQEIKKEFRLKLDKETFAKLPQNFQDYFPMVKEKTERIMKIADDRHIARELKEIYNRVVKEVFETKYGHEPKITPEMAGVFSETLADEIVKYIYGTR